MTKKLEVIRDYCCECGGEGEVSHCCQAEVDDHRCLSCGRYCKKEVCYSCEGYGHTEYRLGDEVDIFVCVWSEDYLKKQFYGWKDDMSSKTHTGDIVEIVDNWNLIVKVGRKKINVKVEDISTR